MKVSRYSRRNKIKRWYLRHGRSSIRRLAPAAWLAAPILAALLRTIYERKRVLKCTQKRPSCNISAWSFLFNICYYTQVG